MEGKYLGFEKFHISEAIGLTLHQGFSSMLSSRWYTTPKINTKQPIIEKMVKDAMDAAIAKNQKALGFLK